MDYSISLAGSLPDATPSDAADLRDDLASKVASLASGLPGVQSAVYTVNEQHRVIPKEEA